MKRREVEVTTTDAPTDFDPVRDRGPAWADADAVETWALCWLHEQTDPLPLPDAVEVLADLYARTGKPVTVRALTRALR